MSAYGTAASATGCPTASGCRTDCYWRTGRAALRAAESWPRVTPDCATVELIPGLPSWQPCLSARGSFLVQRPGQLAVGRAGSLQLRFAFLQARRQFGVGLLQAGDPALKLPSTASPATPCPPSGWRRRRRCARCWGPAGPRAGYCRSPAAAGPAAPCSTPSTTPRPRKMRHCCPWSGRWTSRSGPAPACAPCAAQRRELDPVLRGFDHLGDD